MAAIGARGISGDPKTPSRYRAAFEGTDAGTEALNALLTWTMHEVREAVLLGAHGLPVAALVGLPLTHVALGVHVAQAGLMDPPDM